MLTPGLLYRYFILPLLLCLLSCKNTSGNSFNKIENQNIRLSDSLLPYVQYQEDFMVFTNATLVDGTGKSIKPNQTIIIENGVFKTIGNDSEFDIPANIMTINLNGKTIIPGIVGMHNHLHIPRFPFVGDIASKLYLASGVTTIQTCGAASPEQELILSKTLRRKNKLARILYQVLPL